MTDDTTELPLFPTTAPEVVRDPGPTAALFADVLDRLADVIDLRDDQIGLPTPCQDFTAGGLQQHVLGWLGFFAAALSDPDAHSPRPDPGAAPSVAASAAAPVVRRCRDDIRAAVAAGVAGRIVTMSESRMAGDGVLAMALGEYIVHAWDLAVATGRPYDAPAAAVVPAHEFLLGAVAPEYRGADSGFFGEEVAVAADAPPLDRLLGFAGRDPHWRP